MNINQKGFANIILVIVIIILVGAVGYFAFVKKSEPIAQQTTTPSSMQTQKPVSPTPTPDKTANWKTYTNVQNGFEVRYPNTWKVSESNTSVNFRPINAQDVALSFFVYNKPINEAEASLPLFSVPGRKVDSRTNVTINNINWVKLVVEKNQIAQLTYNDGKTYAATYSTFEDVSPQILSTLKFNDSSSTTNWKTYTNAQYGFEIKYPTSQQVMGDFNQNKSINISNSAGTDTFIIKFSTKTVEQVKSGILGQGYSLVSDESIIFNGYNATKLVYRAEGPGGNDPYNTVLIGHGGGTFEITYALQDYTSMLSTFKFTK